jgi:hypothetical protein
MNTSANAFFSTAELLIKSGSSTAAGGLIAPLCDYRSARAKGCPVNGLILNNFSGLDNKVNFQERDNDKS